MKCGAELWRGTTSGEVRRGAGAWRQAKAVRGGPRGSRGSPWSRSKSRQRRALPGRRARSERSQGKGSGRRRAKLRLTEEVGGGPGHGRGCRWHMDRGQAAATSATLSPVCFINIVLQVCLWVLIGGHGFEWKIWPCGGMYSFMFLTIMEWSFNGC